MSSVYKTAHVLLYVNTHIGIHNDTTKLTTRSNSKKCKLNFNDSHYKFEIKSPYDGHEIFLEFGHRQSLLVWIFQICFLYFGGSMPSLIN